MGTDRQEIKAAAAAEKARAKAMRPWFKKKRFVIPIAFFTLLVVIAAAGGGGGDTTNVNSASSDSDVTLAPGEAATAPSQPAATAATNAKLFPGRVDAQKEDQERQIGQSSMFSGYTTTVNSAAFVQSLSDFQRDGYINIDVTILNRDTKAQSYSTFDWKLQTPAGTVIDPTFTTRDDELDSADLVTGGSASGDVYFKVGAAKGTYYIIYKPDAFDAARGIWSVTV